VESPSNFKALMDRVREGSPEASRELYDRYGHHILHVVRRKLHSKLRPKFDSLDFVQDVWASFFAAEPREQRFESPSALAAFLAQVARNKVAEAFRTRLQRQKFNLNRENSLDGSAAFHAESLVGPDPTGSQLAVANETYDRLTQGQPAHHRRILELLHQGHTHLDIATSLGVNEKTIRRLIRKLQGA
jgi:RNA polymerase sigma factor (sigma-70 family)